MDLSVVALPLPQALEALEAAGKRVSQVLETGPPRMKDGGHPPRVIRERETDEGIELTVAAPIRGPRYKATE